MDAEYGKSLDFESTTYEVLLTNRLSVCCFLRNSLK